MSPEDERLSSERRNSIASAWQDDTTAWEGRACLA